GRLRGTRSGPLTPLVASPPPRRCSPAIRLSSIDRWTLAKGEHARMERDVSWLRSLGWTPERQQQLESLGDPTLVAARVGVEHRGAYGLLGAPVESAQPAGRLRQEEGLWPAVGDWVAVQPAGGHGLIHHVLPRTTALGRRRPML